MNGSSRLNGIAPHREYLYLALFLMLLSWTTQLLAQVESIDKPTKPSTTEVAATSVMQQIQPVLIEGNYQEKAIAIDTIAQQDRTLALRLLKAILGADLFYDKAKKGLYEIKPTDHGYQVAALTDADTFVDMPLIESKSGYKKVRINNSLRGRLRQAIASIQLKDEDPSVRLEAVDQMLKDLDDAALARIANMRQIENNTKVKELMDVALAVGALQRGNPEQSAAAIATLGASLQPVALNNLRFFAEGTASKTLKKAAENAIESIEGKQRFFEKLETLYFGLSFGSVLLLAGIGLAITFGVMGVINMAHGELIMIGAYTTFVIQQMLPGLLELSIIIAIPAAFLVSALVGILMERLVIRHLYGRPLETLLATFGISLVLQQAVRSIFSPLNRSVVTPEWMSGMLEINSVFSITWNRFYIIVFSLVVFFTLLMVMKKSALGLHVRAVSQNRNMARAMGVRSERVDILTFGLGSGIAGIAGVALSLLTNVGPNLGQAYIIDSFIVVVFGGVGNLFGTLLAAMSLGVANKFMEPWAGAVLAKILLLIFIILFIQKRPQGLFPQRGRAAEN